MWSPSFKDELKNYWSSDKADSAYSFWRNRTDARINTKVTAQHKFLAMISGNDYETPTANQNLFRETFKERYNEMFISKWNDRASTRVSYIQKEARAMYWEVVTGYARDLGYNHGYEQAFRPASIEGYKQTFAPSQKAAFDNAVQRYSTKEVITQVMTSFENASLKTSPRPRSGAPGDQIKFSINSVTNLATVPATLEVTVLNAKLASYSIGASTKTNKPKDYGVVAALPNDFPFDAKIISQKISINGTVGDYSQSQSFEITLRGYLQKLSMMPNGQEKYNYGLMLVAALRAEWTPASDGDDYDNKDGTLLHQVVAVVAQLTPQDRAAIKTLVPAIKSAYPSERPGFFSGVRDDWDAAMKLIEKIEKN
jgi:hypothetical protein